MATITNTVRRRPGRPIGIPVSAETRAKISAAMSGRKCAGRKSCGIPSAVTRAKISAANRGRKCTPEQLVAMSICHTEAGNRPATIEKHKAARSAWWAALTPERRAALLAARSAGQKARWRKLTKAQRRDKLRGTIAAGAAATRDLWAGLTAEQKAAKLSPVWRASQMKRPTGIERAVAALLDALGVEHLPQYLIGNRFVVDFYVPSRKLVIECDGSYWHSLPGRAEKDAARDAWLSAHGFVILRLPERDINAGRHIEAVIGAVR